MSAAGDLCTSVLEGLSLLHPPELGHVFEVRIPIPRGAHGGYFDDPGLAAAAIEAAGKYRRSIYTTLSPCDPALLARAHNRLVERADTLTNDKQIVRRLRLLIDVDPKRPAGISATDGELRAALDRRDHVVAWLTTEHGWPEPALIMSGNGGHAIYGLDLDVTPETDLLIKNVLRALDALYSDDVAEIDTSVSNASRITKIPGTVSRKGDATADRPHRRAEIEQAPDRLVPVTLEQLRAVAALAPVNGTGQRPPASSAGPRASSTVSREERMRRAAAYVARINPAVAGHHGDDQTVVAAMRCWDLGLDDGDAFAVLRDEYNPRCSPPWSDHDLARKVRSAYKSAKGPFGGKLTEDRPGWRPSSGSSAPSGSGSPDAGQTAGDAASSARGRVVIEGGKLSAIVDQVEGALLGSSIFQRGGLLTRAVKLDASVDVERHVRREAGSTVLIPVREPWLGERMGQALDWCRADQKDKVRPCDVPSLYPRTLLSRAEWRFPVLRAVVTAPTLGRDGEIIEAPGFDAGSGLLVDVTPGSFPPVPMAPTQDDARAALALLAGPLRGFPFVDEAARAVALAAMLTALIRNSLKTAPLHGFDAPTAGTGKSMCAEATGLLATGFRPPALSQGKTPEEDEKRLATILFAGDPVILIDNCEAPISGDFLCSMLTQETVQARVLGQSERRILPCTALVLASGNNLAFAGDASRRAVVCRMDAQQERPDTRAFDFDVHQEVLAGRPELVVAGLTVLRAYHLAGRPVSLTPMGSFAEWSWIRGALVWLDCADPADTRLSILENDPRKDDLIAVLELWDRGIGGDAVDVGEITRRAEADVQARTLRDKLIEVACRGDKWNSRSVGWWIRRHKDRVVGGKSLQADHEGRTGQLWRLKTTPEG